MDDRRSRPVRLALLTLLLAGGLAAAPAARAQLPVPTPPPTASAPGCHTVDTTGQPATLFGPGDRFVVKGEGFGEVSAIRVTFVQGTQNQSLAVAYSDELGVFSTGALAIPADAAPGPASVHAFSTTKVAQCAVQIMAAAGGSAAAPKPHKKRSLLVMLWWALLAAFGAFLVVVLVRRWRARRLAAKVGRPAGEEPLEEPDLLEPPILEEARLPSPPDAQGPPPAILRPPILDEPDDAVPQREPAAPPAPPPAPPPPERPRRPEEVPVLDLLPRSEPASPPPPEPQAEPGPAGDDEMEEFVYRDGKWRLRDQVRPSPAVRRSPVDVAEARQVADALSVPQVGRRPDDEPPLLDPESFETPPPAPAPPASDGVRVEGTVSETVARLVENTKDWTKR